MSRRRRAAWIALAVALAVGDVPASVRADTLDATLTTLVSGRRDPRDT